MAKPFPSNHFLGIAFVLYATYNLYYWTTQNVKIFMLRFSVAMHLLVSFSIITRQILFVGCYKCLI